MTSLGDKGEGHRETTALLGNEDEGSVQTQTKVLNQGSWTQVSCPCCVSEQVEPLVLIQLSDNIQPVTKRWLISLIEVSERDGGERSGQIGSAADQKSSIFVVFCSSSVLLSNISLLVESLVTK